MADHQLEDISEVSSVSLSSADTLPGFASGGDGTAGWVDRYQLRQKLGAGGFGAVHLAEDSEAKIPVALKTLPGQIASSPEELARVRENFALVQKLAHPNIAALKHLHKVQRVDDAASQALRVLPGDYLLVMEYVPGSTLSSWRALFPERKVPLAQALPLCRQIAAALDYAHAEKVVHRDIKPANIMVTDDADGAPRVKILDFGLAAEIRSSLSRVSTEAGDTSGTRPYMSPEQWSGRRQGAAADQYSLAALLYELLSSGVPFASAFATNDPIVMLNAGTILLPEPLPVLNRSQNAALLRALAKEPEQRFASCGDFIAALQGKRVAPPGTRQKSSAWSGSRLRLIAVCLLLLALAAGAAHAWRTRQTSQGLLRDAVEKIRADFSALHSSQAALLEEFPQSAYGEAVRLCDQAEAVFTRGRLSLATVAYGEALSALQAAVAASESARLSRLGAERGAKLSSLAGEAAQALSAGNYSAVNRLADEMLLLDPENQDALQLRVQVDRAAGPAILAEERGRAETLLHADNLGSVSREDGFGKLIDEVRTAMSAAGHLQTQDQYLALGKYRDTVALARKVLKLDQERRSARQSRARAKEARETAAAVQAATDAAEQFASAAQAADAGERSFAAGKFADAEKSWSAAASGYSGAAQRAKLMQDYRQAREAFEQALAPERTLLEQYGGGQWQGIQRQISLGAASGNDPSAGTTAYRAAQSALPNAVSEARTAQRTAQLEAVAAILRERLARATAAKQRGDWEEALKLLAQALPPAPFDGAYSTETLQELQRQLEKLAEETRAGQHAAQLEGHLVSARSAATRRDWAAVKAAAEKALALAPGHTEGGKLRETAYDHQPRVPIGYRIAPGTSAEPYTNSGWAQAIIHEATGIELVYIPAGSFLMGSPGNESARDDDETQHQVTLSQGFYLGKYEVTQGQWQKLMGSNPAHFSKAGADAPVESVTWNDCQEFCRRAGSGLRLPSEAEWEYACRAGSTTPFHCGYSLDASMANFDGNHPYGQGKKGEYRGRTIPVGQFQPNAWGLYDMIGNVWEWCQDRYGSYPSGAATDPKGPDSGESRVLRGGGWYIDARFCRSASRNGYRPFSRIINLGLRVGCSAPPVQ